MATKKSPEVKIVLRCLKDTDYPRNNYEVLSPYTKDLGQLSINSVRCPHCNMKLVVDPAEMAFRAHGKSKDTIAHELLLIKEI